MPTDLNVFALGGAAALIALVASGWQQLKAVVLQLSAYVVTSADFNEQQAWALLTYAKNQRHLAPVRWQYHADWRALKSLGGQRLLRPYALLTNSMVIRVGRWPVFISKGTNPGRHDFALTVYYVRGTIDPDALAVAACDAHDAAVRPREDAEPDPSRFEVYHRTGTAGRDVMLDREPAKGDTAPGGKAPAAAPDAAVMRNWRAVGFGWEDVGLPDPQDPLDRVALPPGAAEIVADVDDWYRSEQWCRDRGVPWRRGYQLDGEPGNGKSAFVKALGIKYGLKVYVFHLPTLRDEELIAAWRDACRYAPSIALFEDFDAVYAGRELRTTGPSFDALLNCLSGVETGDGVLAIFTTNHPEAIDEAITERPGRVDLRCHFPAPDEAGRRKIAARILDEYPAAAAALVEAAVGESGAFVESVAVAAAFRLRFDRGVNTDQSAVVAREVARMRDARRKEAVRALPLPLAGLDFAAEQNRMHAEIELARHRHSSSAEPKPKPLHACANGSAH
jgi:hypothetical protein